MQEICTVVKIKNKTTYVSLKKSAKCDGCKACGFGRNNELIMPVISKEDFAVGDVVSVNMPEKQFPAAYLALYLIPLLFLSIGFVIGKFALNEVGMLILGVAFLLVGFIPAYLIDKALRKKEKYMPTIIEKVS